MFRLRIAKVGNQELSAAFVIQDEGGAEYTVVVPVRYQGIEGRPKTGGDAP
jgi:hypothetical protein